MKKLALCKACNKPLIWKQPYKKGDRPVEKDGSVHNCPKWRGKNEEKITSYGKKYEYERCPYCKGSNYGYCRKGTKDMEVHVKAYHPNGEILHDSDFKMKVDNKFIEEKRSALKIIRNSWESDFQSF